MKKQAMMQSDSWIYRGHRLHRVEWGLWRDTTRSDCFLLCYRPAGRQGPVVRRWARTSVAGISLEELKRHVRAVHANASRRTLHLPTRITVDDSAQAFYQELERLARSRSHCEGVAYTLDAFCHVARGRDIADVDVRLILSFLNRISEGRSPRTHNRHRSHLHAWLAWAVSRGEISINPVTHIKSATEERKLHAFPSPEDFLQLVQNASPPWDACIWSFLALTGLRRGSFLSMTLESFQDEGILIPHTKRRQQWFINYDQGCPLWDDGLSLLGRRIWMDRIPTVAILRHHWIAQRRRMGHPWTLHSLRHAFCSWLILMGEPIQDIAGWAHHSNSTTTERWYAHLRPRGRARIEANRRKVFTLRSHLYELCQIEGPKGRAQAHI